MIHKNTITVPQLLMPGHVLGPYWLLHDDNDPNVAEVVSLISHASPKAMFLGCGEAPPADGTLVLFRPDSFAQMEKLIEDGIEPDRLSFMPLTTEYPWAPWVIWGNFKDRPDLRKNLRSHEACAYNTLRSWPMAGDWAKYWATTYRPYIKDHRSLFDMVFNGLCDERSRQLFNMVLRCDPTGMWEHFIDNAFTTCDYLSRAMPFAGDAILNLGVFSGPELPYFMTLVGKNGIVYNIDPLGHDKFDDYVRAFVATCPGRAREVRIAAGQTSKRLTLRICSDGQMRRGDDLAAQEVVVPSLPLDRYVEQENIQSIDFIKIDIEGMEIEALLGMSETIRRCRPILAVSIYHTPEHLWRIPLTLMQGLSDYDFYIDHFSPMWTETVLTAVPKELGGIAHGLNATCEKSALSRSLGTQR